MTTLIDKEEIYKYASKEGVQQAYNIMLLLGPDGFDGTYEDYQTVMDDFETKLNNI